MKKILLIVLISLFITGCHYKKKNVNEPIIYEPIYGEGQLMDESVIEKLLMTNKIVVKIGKFESTIENYDSISEIVNLIINSRQTEDMFLCDGGGVKLYMYNNSTLIDTVTVWTYTAGSNLSERVMPKSISNGCEYYYVQAEKTNLKQIIERETGYKFYSIYDYTDVCASALELIYEDDYFKYYFDCIKSDNVFIEFATTNTKITVKEALNNNYITPSELLDQYPDLLIKKSKEDLIDEYLDKIVHNGPIYSSSPLDYIEENKIEFEYLLSTPKESFEFAIRDLVKENKGLKSYIEAVLCLKINDSFKTSFTTASEFLNKYKSYLQEQDILSINEYDRYALAVFDFHDLIEELKSTDKIIVYNSIHSKQLKTIEDKQKIDDILGIIADSKPFYGSITLQSNNYYFEMYKDNKKINTISFRYDGLIGFDKQLFRYGSFVNSPKDKQTLMNL